MPISEVELHGSSFDISSLSRLLTGYHIGLSKQVATSTRLHDHRQPPNPTTTREVYQPSAVTVLRASGH
eukprot:19453-Hanusia_phi.AAC.1